MPAIRIFPTRCGAAVAPAETQTNGDSYEFIRIKNLSLSVHLLRMHERAGATTCTNHFSTGLPWHLPVSLDGRGCRWQRLVSILRLLGFASLATDAGERSEARLTPVESVKARMNSLHSHVKGTREFAAFTCAWKGSPGVLF